MTDFLRFITQLYRDPQWNETPAGTQAALSQNNASFVQNYTPRQIQFNPEDTSQFTQQFRQQTQSGDRDLRALETLFNQFQTERAQTHERISQMNGMTPEAKVQLIDQILSQNDRVLGIAFMRLDRIIRENNIAALPRALQQYNEAVQHYLEDHRLMETHHADRVPEDTVKDVYDLILQPTLSLMSLLNNRLSQADHNNERISREVRHSTEQIRDAWNLIAGAIPNTPSTPAYEGDGRHFRFLKEFAQGQSELMQIALNEDTDQSSQNPNLLDNARTHLNNAYRQTQETVNQLHPPQDSDLEYFTSIVSSTAPRHSQFLPPLPTPTEAAREVITANTFSFISTICWEIDHSHRTAPEVMNERYTRFQMVMNALLTVQPHLNLREAMTRLQNLRWNDQLYNHMQGWITRRNQDPAHAQSQISFQTVIESLENANHLLHGEVIQQIESFVTRNQTNPHHQNISTQNLNHPTNGALTLLKGSQTLHAMLPLLARSLHGALASMPANSQDRAVLLNFFRSTAERDDPSREPFERGKREIIVALFSANQQEPSADALTRFRNSGHEERVNGRTVNQARAFVDNLIDFIQHRSLDQNHLQENLTRARRIQIHPALENAAELNQRAIIRFAVNDPELELSPTHPLRRNAVPPWLLALQRETYTATSQSSAEQNNQRIIQNLREVAVALEEGRILSETDSSAQGYERNYGNLIAFVSAAGGNGGIRNSDGAHVGSDLEHIQRILRTDNRGIFDDSHALLDELLNHDAQALNGRNDQNLGVIVNSWAESVLNSLHHHDNNWRANAIHRNERYPASFQAIWQSFAGSTQNANSLAHQLASYHLQNSTLAPNIQQRAQTELHSSHGFRDFMMAFGTVDNLVLTGVMAGSAQWANRSLQASPAVLSGTRIGLTGHLLQSAARMRWYNPARWVTRVGASATGWSGRNPVTAAFAFSGAAGGLYAAHQDEHWRGYNNEHPNDRHEFNLYENWARNTAILFGVSSPLWYPAYFNRMRTFQFWGYRDSGVLRFLAPYNWDWRVKVGSTTAFTVGGGLLVNHWRPHHPRWENLLYGCAGALAIASPLALSAHPLPIQVIEGAWGSRVGAGSTTLGTVAENGQLGFAGHMLVGGASGLAGGLTASSLVAARDGVNGYETHFWRDMAQSTATLGVAMTANSAVGALYSLPGRALRRYQSRRVGDVQAAELERAEREIQSVMNRGRLANGGLGFTRSLASAAVATGGMLVTEAEMRALQNNRLFPNRADMHFSAEEIASTLANMLAFEGMNAAMSRFRMVNLLGRPRATQIDHITNRLLQDVNFANPAERNTTRDFVWRRLAVESLRGRDLSQIAREENIRQWRADFNNGRVLLASRGDTSTHTSIPQTHLPQSTVNNLASQALLHEGAASTPDIHIHIDNRNGTIHPEIPAGENLTDYTTINIEFSGGRVHLSEDTRADLRQLATNHPNLDRLAAELLARHGASVTLNPTAVTLAGIIRGIRAEQLRDRTSLFVTETESANNTLRTAQDVERALREEQAKDSPNQTRLRVLGEQMNLFVNRRLLARVEVDGQMYDIYRGTLETVPEGRRRHKLFEMTIPGIHNPNPSIRPGRIVGLYDRWRSQPNTERIHILPQRDNGRWTALPEAWRNLLNHFENDTLHGQAIEMRAQLTGSSESVLREAHDVYHVGRSQVFNAASFNETTQAWLPTGFEMALQRRGENDWILHNFSTRDGITLQVNRNEVVRNGQHTVNHGDVIKIPAGRATDGSPRFVEITLDLQHSGTAVPAPVVAPVPIAAAASAAEVPSHLLLNTSLAPGGEHLAAPITPPVVSTHPERDLPTTRGRPRMYNDMLNGLIQGTWRTTAPRFEWSNADSMYRYHFPADHNEVVFGRGEWRIPEAGRVKEVISGDDRVSRRHFTIRRMQDASGIAYSLEAHNLVTVYRGDTLVGTPDHGQRIFINPGDRIFITNRVGFIFDPVPATSSSATSSRRTNPVSTAVNWVFERVPSRRAPVSASLPAPEHAATVDPANIHSFTSLTTALVREGVVLEPIAGVENKLRVRTAQSALRVGSQVIPAGEIRDIDLAPGSSLDISYTRANGSAETIRIENSAAPTAPATPAPAAPPVASFGPGAPEAPRTTTPPAAPEAPTPTPVPTPLASPPVSQRDTLPPPAHPSAPEPAAAAATARAAEPAAAPAAPATPEPAASPAPRNSPSTHLPAPTRTITIPSTTFSFTEGPVSIIKLRQPGTHLIGQVRLEITAGASSGLRLDNGTINAGTTCVCKINPGEHADISYLDASNHVITLRIENPEPTPAPRPPATAVISLPAPPAHASHVEAASTFDFNNLDFVNLVNGLSNVGIRIETTPDVRNSLRITTTDTAARVGGEEIPANTTRDIELSLGNHLDISYTKRDGSPETIRIAYTYYPAPSRRADTPFLTVDLGNIPESPSGQTIGPVRITRAASNITINTTSIGGVLISNNTIGNFQRLPNTNFNHEIHPGNYLDISYVDVTGNVQTFRIQNGAHTPPPPPPPRDTLPAAEPTSHPAPQPRAIDVIEDPTLLGDVPGNWLDARFRLTESLRTETARYILVEVSIRGDRIELVKIGQDEERATLTAGPNQIVLDRQNEFERVREGNLGAVSEEDRNALHQIFPEADPDPTHGRNPQILASFARRSAAVDRLRQALDLVNDGRFQIIQSGDNYLVSGTTGTDINCCLGILEVRNQEVHLYTHATEDALADLRSALHLRYNIPRSGKTLKVHHEAPPLPPSGGSGGPGAGNFPSEPTAPVAPGEINTGAGGRMQFPQAAIDALAEFFALPETPAAEPARVERREVRAPAPASVARDPATDIAQWPPYSIAPEQVPQSSDTVFDFLRNLRAEPDYSQSQERLLIPAMLNGAHTAFTRPTRAVQVDGYTFFLSPLIRSTSRDYVLGMVPVRENGHFVLKRRIFYKSLSDGAGWRCPPYVSNGFLGKGDHYVASTQVVPALAEALDQILAERGARSSESTPDLSPEDFANFRDLGTPLQGFTVSRSAAGAEFGTLTHVHHRPAEQVRISFLEELSRYRPAHVFSYNNTAIQGRGYGPYRAIDSAKAERQVQEILALNSRYPEGFIPDFSQTPQRTHQTQHPYLGEVTLRDYPAILQTATGQRPLIWTLAQDRQNRTWCANIRYADSPINSYGVPSEIFDGGILISKPLEYDHQVAGLPERYQRTILDPVTGREDSTYTDMTPFLHELEPIRRFRIAQGLERGTTSTAQAVTSSMQLRTQNSEMQYTPEEEQAPRAASVPAEVTTPPQGTPIVPPPDQPAPAVTRTPAFTRPLPTEHGNPTQTFILEDITTAISLDGIVIEPVPGQANEVKVYAERSPALMGAESLSLGKELEAEITGRFIDVTYVNSHGNVGTIRIERRNHGATDLEVLADLDVIRNMGAAPEAASPPSPPPSPTRGEGEERPALITRQQRVQVLRGNPADVPASIPAAPEVVLSACIVPQTSELRTSHASIQNGNIENLTPENASGRTQVFIIPDHHTRMAIATTQGLGSSYHNNEDGIAAAYRAQDGRVAILDVDGAGGSQNAILATNTILNHFQQNYVAGSHIPDILTTSNAQVYRINPNRPGQTYACAVGVEIVPPANPGEAYHAHFSWVGDSRGMVVEQQADNTWQWTYRTRDHNQVAEFIRFPTSNISIVGGSPTLTQNVHPLASTITRSIGGHANIQVGLTAEGEVPNSTAPNGLALATQFENGVPLRRRSFILLGSDGFWENYGRTQYILDLIRDCNSAEEVHQRLTRETHERMDVVRRRDANELASTNNGRYRFERNQQTLFIDDNGHVYRDETSADIFDHYKPDNFSLGVYEFNPDTAYLNAVRTSSPEAAIPPIRARHEAGEHSLPIAGVVSLTRGTNDSLQTLLRNQGINVPDNSFLAHVRVTRMMGGSRPYFFRVEGPVTFNLSRQGRETTSYGQSNFSGFRHGLGEPGETVILQSCNEAYTLTLQAPESRMTRAPQSRSYQGPGYFQRAANTLETWWAQRANRTQVAMPGPAAPARERRNVRVEMPVVTDAPEQTWIVGRETQNNHPQISLDSRVVARQQAKIIRIGGQYFIEDLSSRPRHQWNLRSPPRLVAQNRGTYVEVTRDNGSLVWTPCNQNQPRLPLQPGQRIGFGSPHAARDSVTGSMEIYTFELDENGNPVLRPVE